MLKRCCKYCDAAVLSSNWQGQSKRKSRMQACQRAMTHGLVCRCFQIALDCPDI